MTRPKRANQAVTGALAALMGASLVFTGAEPAKAGARGDAFDALTCGGKAAMTEGDRLTGVAEQKIAAGENAAGLELLQQSAGLYEKAYKCGYAEAGIPLAARYCVGLGVEKNTRKAHQMILEIEGGDKKQVHVTRTDRLRQLCGLPVPKR